MALARTRKKLQLTKKAAHKAKPKKKKEVNIPIEGVLDPINNPSDRLVRVSELADFKEFNDARYKIKHLKVTDDDGNLFNEDVLCINKEFSGLKFISKQDNSTIAYSNKGTNAPDVQISTDGITWESWDGSIITLNTNEFRYLKGNNPNGFSTGFSNYTKFLINGQIISKGNIMSLLDDNNGSSINEVPVCCFYYAFQGCSGLLTTPKLPATTLSPNCYKAMFHNCNNLIEASDLPAEEVPYAAYEHMFRYCSSLTKAPILKIKTSEQAAMYGMFQNCTNLTEIDLSSFTTFSFKQQNFSYMCYECPNLHVNKESGKLIFTCPNFDPLEQCTYAMFDSIQVNSGDKIYLTE